MDTNKQISLVRRLFDEVFTGGNMDACNELLDTNIRWHDPAININNSGLKGFKKSELNYKKAFPDKKTTINEIFSSGDKVFVSWTVTGTHKGTLEDIPASNKKIKVSGMAVYRFSNGKICEIYQHWDRLGLLEQIGEVQLAHAALHG